MSWARATFWSTHALRKRYGNESKTDTLTSSRFCKVFTTWKIALVICSMIKNRCMPLHHQQRWPRACKHSMKSDLYQTWSLMLFLHTCSLNHTFRGRGTEKHYHTLASLQLSACWRKSTSSILQFSGSALIIGTKRMNTLVNFPIRDFVHNSLKAQIHWAANELNGRF